MREILLCEPQCVNAEHATFNAALLETVALAFPEAGITFLAEAEHIRWVQEARAKRGLSPSRQVDWQTVSVPRPPYRGFSRLPWEVAWVRRVLAYRESHPAALTLLCSVQSTGLVLLKGLLRRRRQAGPVVAVIHNVLNSLVERPPRRPWFRCVSLARALQLPHPPALRYVVLGSSILDALGETHPHLLPLFSAIDIPYLFAAGAAVPPPPSGAPRLGYLGNEGTGFNPFCRLAAAVTGRGCSAEWLLAGYARDTRTWEQTGRLVAGVSPKPLPLEEYQRRVESMTYVAFTRDPRPYRLSATASFLDALAVVRPIIALDNPFIRHHMQRMGDIGYLCSSLESMADTIVELVARFPAERYRAQCENILAHRRLFSPESVAPGLREAVARRAAAEE